MERHNQSLWHLGQNIEPGDFFVYSICDNTIRMTGTCYTIQLDFHTQLISPSGPTWVVQAEIDSVDKTSHHIFLVDSDTFDIVTDNTGIRHARSVEKTLFYLADFATSTNPKPLDVGTVWGNIPSLLPHTELISMAEDTATISNGTMPVFVLEYWIFESSIITISPKLGLPISAIIYDPYATLDNPSPVFTLQLLEYGA